jgi:stage III sporulation protein AE
MKRLLFFALLCLLLTVPLTVSASAEEEMEKIPTEYDALLEALPEEVRKLLPEALFSSDLTDVAEGTGEMSSAAYLAEAVLSLVGLRIGDCIKTLALVCGLLLLCSVCVSVRNLLRSERVARAFSFLSTLTVTAAIFSTGFDSIRSVTDYFQSLERLTLTLIPLTGALYAMGGNVTAAVASSSGLTVFLLVLKEIVSRTVIPFCGICLAFALIRALDPSIRLGTLCDTVKKNYTTLLAFLMMLLSAMLASQTLLAASGDSIAMRSAKFAAGNMIPVVGGSVAELLRTVSTGVGYLRGTVGISAVILLLLTVLPTLVELLLVRLTWQICASFADLLGCDGEKKILDEIASLSGYLITAVAITSSVVVLALSLLIRCTSAIG